jgi:23S rRNA pseudouridine1911/1915/1917 synthase
MVAPSADRAFEGGPVDEPEGAAEPWDAVVDRRETIVAAALHGQRLDRAVVALAPEFSRSHLQSLIAQGHVNVDAAAVTTASRKVRSGQRLQVVLVPTAESRAFRAEPIALDVVHEDDELVVLNKAAGLVVHPAAGNWTGTLLNGLLHRYPVAATLPRAGIVHRLDKDTSGLMVVGKTLPAVTALTRDIAAREVQREYLAIVHGSVGPDAFRIDAPIGRDPRSRIRMAVVTSGRPAQTEVRCLLRRGDLSLVECRLHTGRTHQIRVHLAARGHPLVADATYGGRPALGMTRQALHALRLGFRHPAGQETVRFEAAPPPDFAQALETLRGAATTS